VRSRRAIRYITRPRASHVGGWFRFYPSRFGRASPAHKVFLLSNLIFLLSSRKNPLSSYFFLLSSHKNPLSSYFFLIFGAAEQNFGAAERNFAGTKQNFGATVQNFGAAEQI
jgi:hypothetical protein